MSCTLVNLATLDDFVMYAIKIIHKELADYKYLRRGDHILTLLGVTPIPKVNPFWIILPY